MSDQTEIEKRIASLRLNLSKKLVDLEYDVTADRRAEKRFIWISFALLAFELLALGFLMLGLSGSGVFAMASFFCLAAAIMYFAGFFSGQRRRWNRPLLAGMFVSDLSDYFKAHNESLDRCQRCLVTASVLDEQLSNHVFSAIESVLDELQPNLEDWHYLANFCEKLVTLGVTRQVFKEFTKHTGREMPSLQNVQDKVLPRMKILRTRLKRSTDLIHQLENQDTLNKIFNG